MSKGNNYEGQTLDGRYRVERLLGRGGMGAVYEGRHTVVGKRVAIKMLHAEFAANEEVLKRFYREAQAAAAIGHKNIIDVMDVGVTPLNEPYLVMEYLEGEDLESMLSRTGPLSLEATCGIMEPALLALAAAHAKGIVHRDLKPANIFLCREESGTPTVKLIDFGISKISSPEGSTKLTQTGSLLGTPAYMSPEQAKGLSAIDHRSDIYSMGVILYQMLTGQLPYRGDNYNMLLVNVLTTEPRPLRELRPELPAEAEALVLKQLSKEPSERSQSASGMLGELQHLTAFAERVSGLSILGTHIRSGVASGDLGQATGKKGSPSSAARVLSQMARNTPGSWAGTRADKGPRVAIAIGAAAVLAVAGVLAFVFLGEAKPPAPPVAVPLAVPQVPATVSAPAAPAEPARSPAAAEPAQQAPAAAVHISVTGLPGGARILWDNAPVPVNPFTVDRKESLVKLEVRAEGYEPFITMVAPSEDRAIEAELRRVERHRGAHAADRAVAEVPAAPAPAKDGKMKDGKRGTKFGATFE
jgi:eukaryotic-like serine/threonine-protein kinase